METTPTEYVEIARAESDRGEVVLRERRDPVAGEHITAPLELRVNGVFVMDTLETSTERELARAALAQVEDPRRVVVAGLGLGYTMHEVLADHRVEHVAVVELEPAVAQWMRDGTIPHGPGFLADSRVQLLEADIRVAVAEAAGAAYDLFLLDVDNGPDFLVHGDNAAVYEREFLAQLRGCLRPGGVLVVWSSSESAALKDELAAVFGQVTATPHDVVLQGRDEQYWLYLARGEVPPEEDAARR